jgi:DNA modification methylase
MRASTLSGGKANQPQGSVYRECPKCGARRIDRQLGLEATPDEYLATMVAVFREIRRVLRPDGTCWVNMGDSYATSSSERLKTQSGAAQRPCFDMTELPAKRVPIGLKPKDLLMMPARLALALQADGWWLRSMLPWVKRNPMPESAKDRPANAIEYVMMLTKSARYFWDAEAVKRRPNASTESLARYAYGRYEGNGGSKREQRTGKPDFLTKDGNDYGTATGTRAFRNSDLFYDSLEPPYGLICDADGLPIALDVNSAGFPGAHFATFPSKLIEPLIRGATSERGCCAQCGKPWVRQISVEYSKRRPSAGSDARSRGEDKFSIANGGSGYRGDNLVREVETTGWQPSCTHDAGVVPATVLDCFAGAGTTLLVADRLQRDAIGIELNTAYTEMAMQRCRDDAPLFTSWPPAEDPADTRMADLFAEAAE